MKIEVEERMNSCEIKINAKGQYSGEVKVYDSSIAGAYNQAIDYAKRLEAVVMKKNGKGGDVSDE